MKIANSRNTFRLFVACGLVCLGGLLFAALAVACSGGGGSECREKPTVTTETPSPIGAHDATFKGTVNPQGCETSYEFEYRPVGGSIFSHSGGSVLGGFITPQSVSVHVSGLAANAKYEVRTTATNLKGTTSGNIVTFTTKFDPPSVTTKPASEISTTTALLNGLINANSSATTYFFQYGLTTEYGSVSAPGELAGGTESVAVKTKIEKLKPETLYHFRLTASNGGGSKSGLDETFKTK